jgi:hypothetical protein
VAAEARHKQQGLPLKRRKIRHHDRATQNEPRACIDAFEVEVDDETLEEGVRNFEVCQG